MAEARGWDSAERAGLAARAGTASTDEYWLAGELAWGNSQVMAYEDNEQRQHIG